MVRAFILAAALALGGAATLPAAHAQATEALLKERALAGDAQSAYLLGLFFEQGMNVEKNPREAMRYYAMGASLGHAKAALAHGRMLAAGRGVKRNPDGAAFRFRQAIGLGETDAARDLADLLEAHARSQENGLDSPHAEAALMWWTVDGARGHAASAGRARALGAAMPEARSRTALDLAEACTRQGGNDCLALEPEGTDSFPAPAPQGRASASALPRQPWTGELKGLDVDIPALRQGSEGEGDANAPKRPVLDLSLSKKLSSETPERPGPAGGTDRPSLYDQLLSGETGAAQPEQAQRKADNQSLYDALMDGVQEDSGSGANALRPAPGVQINPALTGAARLEPGAPAGRASPADRPAQQATATPGPLPGSAAARWQELRDRMRGKGGSEGESAESGEGSSSD